MCFPCFSTSVAPAPTTLASVDDARTVRRSSHTSSRTRISQAAAEAFGTRPSGSVAGQLPAPSGAAQGLAYVIGNTPPTAPAPAAVASPSIASTQPPSGSSQKSGTVAAASSPGVLLVNPAAMRARGDSLAISQLSTGACAGSRPGSMSAVHTSAFRLLQPAFDAAAENAAGQSGGKILSFQ